MTKPNLDIWKQVINGPDTYKAVATQLMMDGSCIIGWTDRKDTHYDVLFTVSPKSFGSLQGGIYGRGYLYISIMKRGCFAFRIARTEPLFPSYIGEKLGERGRDAVNALTDLINGVMLEIIANTE